VYRPQLQARCSLAGKLTNHGSHIYLRSREVRTKKKFDNKLQAIVTQKKAPKIYNFSINGTK
jgi:hypothetical protein